MQEGKQYFVNRITFVGNTTTRDNVIRREMRLVESGVFNTEALKFSVKRLNQLGYFKPLEGEAIDVEKTAGRRQQGRRQAEVRGAEPQPAHVRRRRVAVRRLLRAARRSRRRTSSAAARPSRVSAQQGSRATNYQLAFTEPFLFDRPQTAGVDLFIRELQYIGLYTQKSPGGNVVYGFQVADFARMFVNYSYEDVQVKDLNPALQRSARCSRSNPLLADSLLIGEGGKRTISKIGPSYVYNTVDNPIFPTAGKRFTLSVDFAGLGGNTNFVNPRAEAHLVLPAHATDLARLPRGGRVHQALRRHVALPIFQKIFLGGEYSIRGFDILGADHARAGRAYAGMLVEVAHERVEGAVLDERVVVEGQHVAARGRLDDRVLVGAEAAPDLLGDHLDAGMRRPDRVDRAVVGGVVQHHDPDAHAALAVGLERCEAGERVIAIGVVDDRHDEIGDGTAHLLSPPRGIA